MESSLSFQQIWISKGKYGESDPSIVHNSFSELTVLAGHISVQQFFFFLEVGPVSQVRWLFHCFFFVFFSLPDFALLHREHPHHVSSQENEDARKV